MSKQVRQETFDKLRFQFQKVRDYGEAVADLKLALFTYEKTGDHNHGQGPLPVGAPCPGGDCVVAFVREWLTAHDVLVQAAINGFIQRGCGDGAHAALADGQPFPKRCMRCMRMISDEGLELVP